MKILPFIAAANSAFGKSVTDISNLLSFSHINIVGFDVKTAIPFILVGLGSSNLF